MEVATAFRRHLLGHDPTTGYVQQRVFKYRLGEKIDGTGGRAVVVYPNNGWATPDPVTTQEYPILAVKCFADHDRDDDAQIREYNAEDKAMALYRVVDQRLRGIRGRWIGSVGQNPGLFVVTSQRWKEPVITTEKDRHGQQSGDPLGDVVYAYVEYALQVIH